MTTRKAPQPRLLLPPEQEARARALELSIAMGVAGQTPEKLVDRAKVFASFIERATVAPQEAGTIA